MISSMEDIVEESIKGFQCGENPSKVRCQLERPAVDSREIIKFMDKIESFSLIKRPKVSDGLVSTCSV